MKHQSKIIVACLLFAGASATAQVPQSTQTLRAMSSDGPILITDHTVRLRDYVFVVDRIPADGVILLKDDRARATAELDTRSEEGLYFAVTEGAKTMQLVAARKDMTLLEPPASTSPEGSYGGTMKRININLLAGVTR